MRARTAVDLIISVCYWTQIRRGTMVGAADWRSPGPWFNSGWKSWFTFVSWSVNPFFVVLPSSASLWWCCCWVFFFGHRRNHNLSENPPFGPPSSLFGNPPPPFRKLFGTSPPPFAPSPPLSEPSHPFRRTPTPFFLLERNKPKLGHESQHVGTPSTQPINELCTRLTLFPTSTANSREKLLVSSDHLPPTSTTRTTRRALWCGPTNSGYVLAFPSAAASRATPSKVGGTSPGAPI